MPATQPPIERPTVTMDDIKNRWTERVVRPARSGVTQVVTYRGHDACKLMPAEEFEAFRESHPIATTEYKAYDAKRLRAEIVRACEEEGRAALVSAGGRRPVFAFVPLGYPAS